MEGDLFSLLILWVFMQLQATGAILSYSIGFVLMYTSYFGEIKKLSVNEGFIASGFFIYLGCYLFFSLKKS
jgi:hypothetical protein